MSNTGIHAGRADSIYGLVFFVAAAALFAHTYSDLYDTGPLFGDVSTVFVPRILLGLIAALSVALMVKGLLDRSGERLAPINWRRLFLTFAAACLTTAGLWYLGFLIAMPFGVFLTGLAIGYPNRLILAAASIASTGVVWLMLGYVARVSLPEFHLF